MAKLEVTLETAKRLYATGTELKELALGLFNEDELKYVPKFKRGDYLYYNGEHGYCIFIFDCYQKYTISAISYYHNNRNVIFSGDSAKNFIDKDVDLRLATPEEIKRLDDALEKAGKRFNKETLELEDILKEGDIVIVLDNEQQHNAIICPYCEELKEEFDVVIKFHSLEQYYKIIGK